MLAWLQWIPAVFVVLAVAGAFYADWYAKNRLGHKGT